MKAEEPPILHHPPTPAWGLTHISLLLNSQTEMMDEKKESGNSVSLNTYMMNHDEDDRGQTFFDTTAQWFMFNKCFGNLKYMRAFVGVRKLTIVCLL